MIGLFNSFIKGLGTVLVAMLSLLPTSPFVFVSTIDNKYLGYMNYFLPIDSAVAHLEAYVLAVAIYYGLRIVLKWIKAAGN